MRKKSCFRLRSFHEECENCGKNYPTRAYFKRNGENLMNRQGSADTGRRLSGGDYGYIDAYKNASL